MCLILQVAMIEISDLGLEMLYSMAIKSWPVMKGDSDLSNFTTEPILLAGNNSIHVCELHFFSHSMVGRYRFNYVN